MNKPFIAVDELPPGPDPHPLVNKIRVAMGLPPFKYDGTDLLIGTEDEVN